MFFVLSTTHRFHVGSSAFDNLMSLVKESEAFIEVPLFDEPMLLAIYEDHPSANRECVPMADLAKTADAGRWSLFARSGNGFLF